jgi:putative nucleotidyltransferase with HDIG domain
MPMNRIGQSSVILRPPSRALVPFVCLVSAVGLVVLANALYRLPSTPYPLGWVFIGAVTIVAGSFSLRVPGVPVALSISDTFFITSALLFGPAPATVTIALDSLVMSWRLRKGRNRLLQMCFNTTSSAISLSVAAQAFFAMSGTAPLINGPMLPHTSMIGSLACLAALYFALHSGLTAIAVALEKQQPIAQLWRKHFAIISLNHFAAASASFFLIVLLRYMTVAAIAALIPLIGILYVAMRSWWGRLDDAERHMASMNRLYLSTIEALSTAIEAKDGVTSDHIHRVQNYALGLARAMGIEDEPTLKALEAAALLHDTGKLAVPEYILNKPGRLTPAEFEKMKLHVDVGADILSAVDFPYPVVPIVKCHHENWDGTGYPRGLRGTDIPIGARILSVVDCFDALTSDRPYRPALGGEEALAIIIERRGTMYDPDVVDMFVKVHADIEPAVRAAQAPTLAHAVRRITDSRVRTVPREFARPEADHTGSAELLAFASLARVAAGTPTVADIGALAWGHLRLLIPSATCAIYLVDSATGTVVSSYNAGPAADAVGGLRIAVGERLTGWVAAHVRLIVNSDARLDLGDACDTTGLRFTLAMPLIANRQVAGVLTLYAPTAFSSDHERTLQMIAPHFAQAIAAAQAAEASAPAPGDRAAAPRSSLRIVASR